MNMREKKPMGNSESQKSHLVHLTRLDTTNVLNNIPIQFWSKCSVQSTDLIDRRSCKKKKKIVFNKNHYYVYKQNTDQFNI